MAKEFMPWFLFLLLGPFLLGIVSVGRRSTKIKFLKNNPFSTFVEPLCFLGVVFALNKFCFGGVCFNQLLF